jgi:hypothetical protein
LAFTADTNATFEVTGPRNAATLCKSVPKRFGGKTSIMIALRNKENWGELRSFLSKV